MITLLITDYLYEREYEVRVSTQLSFYDLIHELRSMIVQYEKVQPCESESLLVYDAFDFKQCDIDVSLSTLKIENGMHFMIL